MTKRTFTSLLLIMLLGAVLSACGGTTPSTSTSASTTEPITNTSVPITSDAPAAVTETAPTTAADTSDMKDVTIRWFVGLGLGAQPNQIEVENAVVKKWNDEHPNGPKLEIEIVQTLQAYDALKTEIAGGNAPDIVGPNGNAGLNTFRDQWLDLSDLIASNQVDTSVYDKAVVDAYNLPDQGQVALPFSVAPSFIYFNKDLFDEAGLPYPPQEFGQQYQGKEWNFETLRELAMQLTIDKAGNDATNPAFDQDQISQFGFVDQWGGGGLAHTGSLFGSGSLVAEDGKTAQIPEPWRKAIQWYYDGIWTDNFIPNDAYQSSDLFAGNPFGSGKQAMAWGHLWYLCCFEKDKVQNWDIAVVPSYEGQTTAPLHADAFEIIKTTKHPEAAFMIYQYLSNNEDLLTVYGTLPARQDFRDKFFKAQEEKFAPNKITWSVALNSLQYVDKPSHEAVLPNNLEANDTLAAFATKLRTTPDLDVNQELDALQKTLQGIYAKAPSQ